MKFRPIFSIRDMFWLTLVVGLIIVACWSWQARRDAVEKNAELKEKLDTQDKAMTDMIIMVRDKLPKRVRPEFGESRGFPGGQGSGFGFPADKEQASGP